MKKIVICKRCVMDNNGDNYIEFDKDGYCNYCNNAINEMKTTYFPNEYGNTELSKIIDKIKIENKDKKYDCVMGISGGLDSSYLAYLGHKWGLRILGVHIDDGYDTETSKNNIEKLCNKAEIELRTIKPDKIQYNDLLLAYIKAGVPNLAIPQDNILFAFLYDEVKKEKIKYFLSGGNFALESILQKDHVFNAMDTVNIKDIHNKYGNEKIDKLKFISSYQKYIDIKLGKVVTLRPLNYIDYNRDRAFKELKEFCDFEYYGSKHLENKLTAFVQTYWFPNKFGVDKRKSHYSSMIISKQMSREQALCELKKPMYDVDVMNEYINEICLNINISRKELDRYLSSQSHEHDNYRIDKISTIIRKIIK